MHNPQDPALSDHILTDRIEAEQKARVKATGSIWAMATAMLGICIPLVAITESGVILPLAVILGASISTTTVWNKFGKHRDRHLQATQQTQRLEQRLQTLEAILTSDERFEPQLTPATRTNQPQPFNPLQSKPPQP